MTAFTDLLADPYAERLYLVTAYPFAVLATDAEAVAADNRLVGVAGAFVGLLIGDRLRIEGYSESGNQGYATISAVARDASWIELTGLTLDDEASKSITLRGSVVRYYASGSYVTGPDETPANIWYDPRVENALRFRRALVDGTQLGGSSVPGIGDVEMINEDGGLDHLRGWGWAGRRIVVEMGAPGFDRIDFGVLFDGITESIALGDRLVSIAVRDLQKLLEKSLWTPRYKGSGGLEGQAELIGQTKPLLYGWHHHFEPVNLGIVDGRWTYQIHDGPVAAYDSDWHRLYDRGVPLEYTAGDPGEGQWTLDDANGLAVLGGNPVGRITMRAKGSAGPGGFVETAADVIEEIAATRLVLDTDISLTSMTVGTGIKALTVPPTMRLATGTYALIEKIDDPEDVWMFGEITAWDDGTGALGVTVSRSSGSGTHDEWTVSRVGLSAAEIDGQSFTDLNTANSAPLGLYLRDDTPALAAFDRVINSVGGYYGFSRSLLFEVGRIEAPAGDPDLALDGVEVLDLSRMQTVPPLWRLVLGYAYNDAPLRGSDLADSVRANVVTNGTFDSAAGWTEGTGWSITSGEATATAGSASDLSRAVVLVDGMAYILRCTVTVSAGTLQPKLDSTDIGSAISASGDVEVTFTAGAETTLAFAKDAAFAGALDDVSIIPAQRYFFEAEWRFVRAADAGVRAVYGPDTRDETLYSLFRDESDAQTECTRRLALHGVMRDFFAVLAKTQPFAVDIGRTVQLTDASRYQLSAGKLMRAVEMDEDAGDNRVSLALWG